MANDPPTSLSMRFGNTEALKSGMGFVPGERSPRTINRDVKERRAAREAARTLGEAATDPEWVRFIRFRVNEGWSAVEIATQLHFMKRYSWMREKRYSLEFRLRHWPYPHSR